MSFRTIFLCVPFLLLATAASADVYELRTYTTNEGKLDDLNDRFRNHTLALFEKHGMENVGYFVPVDEPKSKNTLIYVLKHKSRDAAKKSWAAFLADKDWQKAFAESRKDGPLLSKAPESVFLKSTDYTSTWKTAASDNDDVFELRIYQAKPNKLEKLDARFRDHTMKLFERHGIKNVAYWHATDGEKAKDHLFYIIKHDSRAASKKSWKAFGQDPDWKKAAKESGVGGLAKRPESTYMKATDYSKIK